MICYTNSSIQRGLLAIVLVNMALPSLGQSADSLRLQAFYQGGRGNCASVALIKAAIDRYGLGRVFDTTRVGPVVNIRLRSGQTLSLTAEERRRAAISARFRRCDNAQTGENYSALPAQEALPILQYAGLCYAVMAKVIEQNGEYGCLKDDTTAAAPTPVRSFQAALRTLGNGVCSDNVYRYLGLEVVNPRHVDFTPSLDFTATPGVVVYSDNHAVALWKKYFDYRGDWIARSREGHCQTEDFNARFYLVLK